MSYGEQIVARCRELARVSEDEGRLTRRYATPAMARANTLVAAWMRDAGMTARLDAAGNLIGRRPGLAGPDAGTLLLGSHLDTVRDAGAFDGPLGVVLAIALVDRLRSEGAALPFALDVLGFADEEGLRFGTAYLGSRAVAGTFAPELFDVRDDDNTTVRGALIAFGGDPRGVPEAARGRDGERILGYVEVHMEQGPVLEDRGVPVGVVSGIAGATRVEVRFTGQAGHAGTVPMRLRRDTAPAVAEMVLACEDAAGSTEGLLATVGKMDVRPGAPNVVAGTGIAFLDIRHAHDRIRAEAVASLHQTAQEIADRRGLGMDWDVRLDNPAVAVDADLTARLEAAAAARGVAAPRIPSGAGHDAVAMAALCPVAMLFVRCAGGLSHHPGEDVAPADAEAALDVLYDMVRGLAA